jgi:hypothetical protein
MHSISFKRIVFLGFLAPALIIFGAIGSVVLGHGQAVMLPSTVTALIFYGALIAVGAACHDGIPLLSEAKPTYFVVLGILTLVLAATVWLAATQGVSGLLWRPLLTAALCLWFGLVLGSFVPRRVFL